MFYSLPVEFCNLRAARPVAQLIQWARSSFLGRAPLQLSCFLLVQLEFCKLQVARPVAQLIQRARSSYFAKFLMRNFFSVVAQLLLYYYELRDSTLNILNKLSQISCWCVIRIFLFFSMKMIELTPFPASSTKHVLECVRDSCWDCDIRGM